MSVPEYKAETLYSGTKVGVYILGTQCLNTAPFCAGAQALVLAARAPSVNYGLWQKKQALAVSRASVIVIDGRSLSIVK